MSLTLCSETPQPLGEKLVGEHTHRVAVLGGHPEGPLGRAEGGGGGKKRKAHALASCFFCCSKNFVVVP